MLADVGRGDEDFRKGDGVVREEVDAEQVFRVGVGVDHARRVDDEADSLQIEKR